MATHHRSLPTLLFVASAFVLPRAAAAQQPPALDSIADACMAADTGTRWREVAAEWKAHAGDPGTDDTLKAHLLALGERDQELRRMAGMVDSLRSEGFARRLMAADSANSAALAAIMARHGWPTPSMVGRDAASAAFLIAQHSDGLQEEALRLMRALPRSEVSGQDLALLQDRVLTGQGKAQRYGTQLTVSADGQSLAFSPIEDVEHVDERRAEVGLFPLSVYRCILEGAYGRPVAAPGGP